MTRPLRSYRVRIYHRNADPVVDEPVSSASGGEDWSRTRQLEAPGFNTTCTVDLGELWSELLTSGATHLDGTASGYELIVKFGATMDWRVNFRVIIDVVYA